MDEQIEMALKIANKHIEPLPDIALPETLLKRVLIRIIQEKDYHLPNYSDAFSNELFGFRFATEKMIPNIEEWLDDRPFSDIKYGQPGYSHIPPLSIQDTAEILHAGNRPHSKFLIITHDLFPYDTMPSFLETILTYGNQKVFDEKCTQYAQQLAKEEEKKHKCLINQSNLLWRLTHYYDNHRKE